MKNILVVDDSASTRSLVRAMIEDLGEEFEVYEAANGFEALKLLPTVSFDLVITDINMPDINGLELISYIKNSENYRDIPVIIISTERSDEDRRRGLSLGATAYVTKPFKVKELQETVLKVLER